MGLGEEGRCVGPLKNVEGRDRRGLVGLTGEGRGREDRGSGNRGGKDDRKGVVQGSDPNPLETPGRRRIRGGGTSDPDCLERHWSDKPVTLDKGN